MSSKQFSQEQKLAIVINAATIGFKEAAEIAGLHYTKGSGVDQAI